MANRMLAVCALGLLMLSGCGKGDDEPGAATGPCAEYADYTGHSGKAVSVYSSVRDVEADKLTKAWERFQQCTGITIDYEGSEKFETDVGVRVNEGRAPDVAFFPQPGLFAAMAKQGALKPVGEAVAKNVDKWYSADWKKYGTVDGQLYAAPLDGNVKSLVWYSPKLFSEKGYAVPETWADMVALSDEIAADGIKPWCAGIESGQATGWPVTDWLEDVLLRTEGPDVYDDWVNHTIPFNDARVAAALDRVGEVLRNPTYVNGGYGDVKSIATTAFQEGGLPILEQKCAMHRQASFYANWWPQGAEVSEDGDIYAFYLPPVDTAKGKPVLGAGMFFGAFNDKPEVQAFEAYLSTPEFANNRAKSSGAVSPNRGLDPNNLSTPIEKLSATVLTDPNVTFRFDGSDLMPAAVGAGTFWTAMTEWINGKDTAAALAQVEASWPA